MEKRIISDGYFSSPGFQVNNAVLQSIVNRYADAQYAIDFDNFVGCLIKLEMLFSKCQQAQQVFHMLTRRHVHNTCIFISVSQLEIFKALDRADKGKMELDIQQVCERMTKVTGLFQMRQLLV